VARGDLAEALRILSPLSLYGRGAGGEGSSPLSPCGRGAGGEGADLRATILYAALLRHGGDKAHAAQLVDQLLDHNPLDPLAILEQHFCGATLDRKVLAGNPQHYLEAACAYMEMNLWDDAAAVVRLADQEPGVARHPFVDFYLGFLADRVGDRDSARRRFEQGSTRTTDYVFPFRNEDLEVLRVGLTYRPDDWKLRYYRGTLLAAKRRWAEALPELVAAVKSPQAAAVAHRNLAEIYWQRLSDPKAAAVQYEAAIARDPNDYTLYVAADTVYAQLGRHERRAKLLASAPAGVKADFRVVLREAWYWFDLGEYQRCLDILQSHEFHPWEGWSGAREVQLRALHARAAKAMRDKRWSDAIRDMEAAIEWPENLGTGQPAEPVYVREHYVLGLCQLGMGHNEQARDYFQKAVDSPHSQRFAGHDSPFKEDEERCRALAAEELKRLGGR
jgi:tetratricopeptide (TPR) repeat protein